MNALPLIQRAEMIARLEALEAEIAQLGWNGRLYTPSGRTPSLLVSGAATLREHIYSQPRVKGAAWFYWWSWAEPIACDAAEAASIITSVLCPDEQ